MEDKGKGILALIMAKKKKGEEDISNQPEEGEEGESTNLLAEDVLDAIKSEDASALEEALKAFVLDCKN